MTRVDLLLLIKRELMLVADALRLGGAILTQYPDLVTLTAMSERSAGQLISVRLVGSSARWPLIARSWRQLKRPTPARTM